MTRFICRWCTGPEVHKYQYMHLALRKCINTKHLGADCTRCRENGDERFMDQPPSCDSFELEKSGVNVLPKGGAR